MEAQGIADSVPKALGAISKNIYANGRQCCQENNSDLLPLRAGPTKEGIPKEQTKQEHNKQAADGGANETR